MTFALMFCRVTIRPSQLMQSFDTKSVWDIFVVSHFFVFYTMKLVCFKRRPLLFCHSQQCCFFFTCVATFYPDQTFTAQGLKEVRIAHSLAPKASNFAKKKYRSKRCLSSCSQQAFNCRFSSLYYNEENEPEL